MNFGPFWLPFWLQNPSKIGSGSDQNGNSKTRCKKVSTNPKKIQKVGLQMGAQKWTLFAAWPLFAVPGGLGTQNDSQGLPQEPLGPVQTSI